jgi:DNA polymerase-1
MEITIDIETNLAHDKIWCCAVSKPDHNTMYFNGLDEVFADTRGASTIIGHNIIGFDSPVLQRVWGVTIEPQKLCDTLVMSRLWHPSLDGGHSLKAWGIRLGMHKGDFTDFDGGYTEEMGEYCLQDVAITTALKKYLTEQLKEDGFSQESIDLEHQVAIICYEQEQNGFKLDIQKATELYQTLAAEMVEIETYMQAVFPPIVTKRVSAKTGKRLMDGVEVFNIGSRPQIAKRLQGLGHKFTERTAKTEKGGGGAIVVNEKVLAAIDLPEARLINRYLMLQKRAVQVDSWISYVQDDGRVHGRVISNGAITGRMTHSTPNMAQCPIVSKPYGTACRQCWTVDKGNKLVGIDASGIELRMLAHYMKDDDYVNLLLEGDVHTANMHSLGVTNRDMAKTFIYAWLYGAGITKTAKILKCSTRVAKIVIKRFLENTPALADLKIRATSEATGGTLPGLDGRRLRIRSEHSALNTLLQGAGAVVMKKALVILHKDLTSNAIPCKIVANIHDEWQIETPEYFADLVGKAGVRAIIKAGEHFKLRCPLDGEYHVGDDWSQTH